jgi:lysophospholipase
MQFDLLDERHYAETMSTSVLPALSSCRVDGWMEAAPTTHNRVNVDPGKLHYVCYRADQFDALHCSTASARFRGVVVISHGFTEFAVKYDEMAWYFLLAGYSVCILEHRGHGFSVRDVSDPNLVWIDDWHRYVEDLSHFCSQVAQEYAGGLPVYLFGHSMGGAIGAAVLQRYPTLFDKAVLSSPMIAPRTGMPLWLAPAVVETACKFGFARHIVPGHAPFVQEINERDYRHASAQRIEWFQSVRSHHVEYQTSAATFAWVREALRMSRSVLKQSQCDRIETPLLLFQATNDDYVLERQESQFVQQVQEGGCYAELVHIENSRHELFGMPNSAMSGYVGGIIDFFNRTLHL